MTTEIDEIRVNTHKLASVQGLSRAESNNLYKDISQKFIKLPMLKLVPETMDNLKNKRSKSTMKTNPTHFTI